MNNNYQELVEKISSEVLNILKDDNPKKISWDEVSEVSNSFGGTLKIFTDLISLKGIDIIIGEFSKGEGLKRHYHRAPTEEVYYILDGEIEVTIGDKKVIACKGDMLSIPPEVIHKPVNQKNEICRILFILSPKEKDDPVVV